jgi:hypothetical protein
LSPKPSKHYKIVSSNTSGNFVILKLEQLDTIPLTTDPFPETRHSVLALKITDAKELGYLPLVFGLTKNQLDTIRTNAQLLKDKFFFTFLSDTYLKEIAVLKKVTTKEEAQRIIEMMKNEKFKPLIEKYAKTETNDMYNAGLASEILNRACIEKGFNPIGAGEAINRIVQ